MAHLVLVHGAWQGSWVWELVTPRLSTAGHSCHAVDLPGSAPDIDNRAGVTFADQVEFLKRLLTEIGEPAIVIAHSGGGLAASQIAEEAPDRVAGIVYVTGMMLPDGSRFPEIVESCTENEPAASGIWPLLVHSAGLTEVPEAAAVEIFFHDCDPGAAAAAAANLTPQSNAARDVAPRLTAGRFGTVPRVYIEALRDRSVLPVVQRRMQALVPGATIRSIDTGHAPMFADPEGLSALLIASIDDLAISPG